MPTLARSQEAYDRFSAAVELPLTLLALLWLPVLVVPLVAHLPADAAGVLSAIDYFVWAAFAVEYRRLQYPGLSGQCGVLADS